MEDGTQEFDQTAFDEIWPHLRVLARSSPSVGTGDDIDEKEESPLTQKLEVIASQIGIAGTVAAVISFGAMSFLGLYLKQGDYQVIIGFAAIHLILLCTQY